ncbi:MAG: glycosyltransferase family 4 protein [Anaerolineales bacterium]|nr:glycosyltransferase family 4 protein [Anaerolineales bacterium]
MIIGVDASRAVAAQRTGTEGYAFFLIQALIPLAAARGHQLRLYFNQPPPDDFPDGRHVEQVVLPFPRLWTHWRLARELHGRPPDIFFTPAHVIPWSYRRPSVATVHDLGYHHYPEAHTQSQLWYLKWSTRLNGRLSRHLIADSRTTAADLIRFYGTPPEKITVVYPGTDPALEPIADPDAITPVLRRYGVHPPYLLYLSTLQPRKNLIRLIRAYVASGVPHQLVIAGKKGWLADPILDEIFHLELDVARRIILPGFVPEGDKAALLSGATALLYPSLYEGFGFPVVEAQQCGTPVLAANTSSLPEIAGDSALLIDPLDVAALADGIRRLTRDPLLRHELVEKGHENVRRFTWRETAARVLGVLETAVAPQPSR